MRVSEDVDRLAALRREDSTRYKEMTRDQLIAAYELHNISWYGPRPLLHQRASVLACLNHNRYLVLLDKGLGKSKVLLDTFAHRYQCEQVKRGLILVQAQAHVHGWVKQCELHAPSFKVQACPSDVEAKRAFFEEVCENPTHSQLTIIDYPSLQMMLCEFDGDRYTILRDNIKAMKRCFDMVMLDEIQGLRDTGSLRYEMVEQLIEPVKYRYGATATLFNQDPTEAWGAIYLLDDGWNFGTTITAFRHFFSKEVYNHFSYSKKKLVFDESKQELFRDWLRGISLRYLMDECVDLPSLRFVRPELVMTDEQRVVYQGVLREVIAAKKVDPEVRISVFSKLRRVMSGFMPVGKEFIPMAKSPKLEWELARIQQWGEPVVIFYEYTTTGEQIVACLKGQGYRIGWMYGGCKNKQEIMKQWDSAAIDVLVIQNTVGSAGLNLQRARRLIFHECPTSAIVRSQAEARIWRMGQDQVSYVYDLFFTNSIEKRVFDRVKDGMNMHQAIVEGAKEVEATT